MRSTLSTPHSVDVYARRRSTSLVDNKFLQPKSLFVTHLTFRILRKFSWTHSYCLPFVRLILLYFSILSDLLSPTAYFRHPAQEWDLYLLKNLAICTRSSKSDVMELPTKYSSTSLSPPFSLLTCLKIGHTHGQTARIQVHGSIVFYKGMFQRLCKLDWPSVRTEAVKFMPLLQQAQWMPLVEEMQGLADGADVEFEDILCLNVRTEIAYGMFNDGCTALSWKSSDRSFIAQNWDVSLSTPIPFPLYSSLLPSILPSFQSDRAQWETTQSPNILSLHITQSPLPSIHMMAEAGIIGKIGLNSSGVGVTLNAIKAKGVDFSKLPCHLSLRTALNSPSRAAAVELLKKVGVASACHITIADAPTGGTGLECSAADIVELPQTSDGICTHSNHFIAEHSEPSKLYLLDSPFRLERIQELIRLEGGERPGFEGIEGLLRDEKNYPTAICRKASEKSAAETLFSVVMDLGGGVGRVKMGRPVEEGERLELRP